MSEIPHEALSRLEVEIRSGRAVFFVGAGMSIDSEFNSTTRLIVRLLIRLRSLAECARLDARSMLRTVTSIEADFSSNFKDKPDIEEAAGLVAECYYEFNDWVCTTFGLYLEAIRRLKAPTRKKFLNRLVVLEEQKRCRLGRPDPVPLTPIDEKFHLALAAENSVAAAKVLFLDTMGFREPGSTMRGDAESTNYRQLHDSYHRILLPRHLVWARFAREGWAPLILTTNFDRLIEGAFRLSGFRPESCKEANKIPIPLNRWATISEPEQFFDRAGQGRSATVVKIHGCARQYEKLSKSGDTQAYLRSMVFTYREIQNWRADSWSRDYFRSILRTRTVVFAGYTSRDPVIHDTLRSVYEEMRDQRRRPDSTKRAAVAQPTKAPAYFIGGISNKGREFHPTEVLRAASAAASGHVPSREDPHPNFIGHEFLGSGFPSPDDLMLWLNHLCYRGSQLDCLRAELKHVLVSTGKMVRSNTVDLICAEFSRLVDDEIQQARRFSDTNDIQSLKRLCRWSYAFHPLLLREFAMADAAVREGGPGFWYTEMRELPDYYFPTTARPAWTAWGAFLELTIRRLAQRIHLRGELLPAIANRPVLILKRSGTRPGHALEICHAGMGKRKGSALPSGTVLSSMQWGIPASSCPWQFPQRKGGASPSRPIISRGSLKRMRAPEAPAVYDIYQNKPAPAAFQTWLSSL